MSRRSSTKARTHLLKQCESDWAPLASGLLHVRCQPSSVATFLHLDSSVCNNRTERVPNMVILRGLVHSCINSLETRSTRVLKQKTRTQRFTHFAPEPTITNQRSSPVFRAPIFNTMPLYLSTMVPQFVERKYTAPPSEVQKRLEISVQ